MLVFSCGSARAQGLFWGLFGVSSFGSMRHRALEGFCSDFEREWLGSCKGFTRLKHEQGPKDKLLTLSHITQRLRLTLLCLRQARRNKVISLALPEPNTLIQCSNRKGRKPGSQTKPHKYHEKAPPKNPSTQEKPDLNPTESCYILTSSE